MWGYRIGLSYLIAETSTDGWRVSARLLFGLDSIGWMGLHHGRMKGIWYGAQFDQESDRNEAICMIHRSLSSGLDGMEIAAVGCDRVESIRYSKELMTAAVFSIPL